MRERDQSARRIMRCYARTLRLLERKTIRLGYASEDARRAAAALDHLERFATEISALFQK